MAKKHSRLLTVQKPINIRPMASKDIVHCMEIERDAFPTLIPPTSFRSELNNRIASYLVACLEITNAPEAQDVPPTESKLEQRTEPDLLRKVLKAVRNTLPVRLMTHESVPNLIVGVIGIWYMVDEAHIVSVAVRNMYRRQGIGELLLIAAIQQAINRHAMIVSLEVRSSNEVAQNLYMKYRFRKRHRKSTAVEA